MRNYLIMIIIRFFGLYSVLLSATCFLLTLCSFPISSCTQIKKKKRFYPEEYEYPNSSVGNGKTFVYRNVSDSADLTFVDYKMVNENGKNYLIARQYNQASTLDSQKYTKDKGLIESYIFFTDPVIKLKGTILQNDVIDDGSRLGKCIGKIEYKAEDYPDYTITMKGEEFFLKDTVINWNGQKLECLKTRQSIWLKLHSKRDSSAHANSNRVSEGYFAKGIGLIRYQGTSQGRSATMVLNEIRDITVSKGKN